MSGRVTVLWFPDWPVYALSRSRGWDVLQPAAVLKEHRILACNAAARAEGVKQGMKQRHALATCPRLLVAEDDPGQQVAVHEDVLLALEQVAAGVETVRPGLVAFPTESLAKYYGGEDKAVELLLDAAVRMEADCQAGTADDVVTAVWAARVGKSIPPGESAQFVAGLPVEALVGEPALGNPRELVDLLRQLGVRTLRQFAQLPRTDVSTRCGQEAVQWHRVACGEVEREVAPRRDVPPIEVRHDMDEPIISTETAAFVARQVAVRLHNELFAAGDACLRLAVRAYLAPPPGYEGPTVIERIWRCREPLTEEETAQRVRWQLDGWITRLRSASAAAAQSAPRDGDVGAELVDAPEVDEPIDADWLSGDVGVEAIELVPVETIPAGRVEMALWGGPDEGIRAARAAAGRAQALIGVQRVLRPIHRGGRALAGRVTTVPYGDEDPEAVAVLPTRQWEGELLFPLPALVGAKSGVNAPDAAEQPSMAHPAARVRVVDAEGEPVGVTGRGVLSGVPARLEWGARTLLITGWAGPWPVDESWWAQGKRYARVQVSTDSDGAYLLVCRGAQWRIEATY